MKQPSQLTQLIWDFYRENQQELDQLQLLANCRVFRRWGVLHIQCLTEEIGEALTEVYSLIREPVSQMRLAPKIKISVKNITVAVFYVTSDRIMA